MSSHTRREPPGKAEMAKAKAKRAQEKAERAKQKAAQAQAERAEVEANVAKEQAAAIAGALQKDEAQRRAYLEEVAEKEAEAVPDWPPDS